MSEEYILIRDIIYDHNERMLNIRKYYPYFKLTDNAFTQFQGGAYAGQIDMGYILMAVLRFFIEENNFKEKEVSYNEYYDFTSKLIRRDFIPDDATEEIRLLYTEDKMNALVGYIFDKIKNDGKPFLYEYFDPDEKKKKVIRMKLIDSKIHENGIAYYITSDAIEFYLDTKEIKDESSISVAQILLGKMIVAKNFKGGIDVIKRINGEVSRLKVRKTEVLNILSHDVFEGIKAYDEFVATGMSWFEEEQKLYKKNMDLVEEMLKRATDDASASQAAEIYKLETELKKSIQRHSELLSACTELHIKADEIIYNAKFGKFRKNFDFRGGLSKMIGDDVPEAMSAVILPVLKTKVNKTFTLSALDKLLTCKSDKEEVAVKETIVEEKEYIYDDVIEEQRINDNFSVFIPEFFLYGERNKEFTLGEFNKYIVDKFGEKVLHSADYYTFLVHFNQKSDYSIKQMSEDTDTFFEEMAIEVLKNKGMYDKYKQAKIAIEPLDDVIEIEDVATVTNIRFVITL